MPCCWARADEVRSKPHPAVGKTLEEAQRNDPLPDELMQTEGQGRPGARETCDLRANFRPGEGNRIVEPEFCQPPVRVLHGTAVRTTCYQKDLSPGLIKLFGDLVAGLGAAHYQHRAGGSAWGVR